MNITCNKCQKRFTNPSNLKKHINKKNPCNIINELKCNICNINFRCNKEKERHENTKRHISIFNTINGNQNIIGDNSSITNNTNYIINMFNPINRFNNTNLDLIREYDINRILNEGEGDKNISSYIEEIRLDDEVKCTDHYNDDLYSLIFIQYLIDIFRKLNFNITIPENHNCRILVFIKKSPQPAVTKCQYLILELKDNIPYQWTEIKYEDFIYELFKLMDLINIKYNLPNLNYIIEYLNKYFKTNNHIQNISKPKIEQKLIALSNIFEYSRDDNNLNNNINEHVKKETKLVNGIEANVKFIENFLTQDD